MRTPFSFSNNLKLNSPFAFVQQYCFIELQCSHEQTCSVWYEIIISVEAYFFGKQDFVQTM